MNDFSGAPEKKKPGRPRKVEEVQEVQEVAVVAWHVVVSMLKERCKPGHIIASVWHPAPDTELVDTLHGNVRVLKGDARYQLSSGEIIEI